MTLQAPLCGHVTSSVTWPLDSQYADCYMWSLVMVHWKLRYKKTRYTAGPTLLYVTYFHFPISIASPLLVRLFEHVWPDDEYSLLFDDRIWSRSGANNSKTARCRKNLTQKSTPLACPLWERRNCMSKNVPPRCSLWTRVILDIDKKCCF